MHAPVTINHPTQGTAPCSILGALLRAGLLAEAIREQIWSDWNACCRGDRRWLPAAESELDDSDSITQQEKKMELCVDPLACGLCEEGVEGKVERQRLVHA